MGARRGSSESRLAARLATWAGGAVRLRARRPAAVMAGSAETEIWCRVRGSYLSDAILKLDAANRTDAARIARERGWL